MFLSSRTRETLSAGIMGRKPVPFLRKATKATFEGASKKML